MIDKFQKLFGPNPKRTTGVTPVAYGYEDDAEDIEHKKRVARIKNKRRVLGLLTLAMLVAVVAPSILSPNDYYADRGAKLEIPGLESDAPAKVIEIERTPKTPERTSNVVSGDEKKEAAKSLSSANKVAADAKPAHPTVDDALVVLEQKPEKKSVATQQKEVVAKATQTAKNSDKKVQTVKSNEKPRAADAKKKADDSAQATGPLRASANGKFFIQVIATSNKDAATRRAQSLVKLGVPAYTEIVHRRGSDLWRVRVGRFMTRQEAQRAMDILALNSVENGGINQEKTSGK